MVLTGRGHEQVEETTKNVVGNMVGILKSSEHVSLKCFTRNFHQNHTCDTTPNF